MKPTTSDEQRVLDLLKNNPLRAIEIMQILRMGMHRIYPILYRLKKYKMVETVEHLAEGRIYLLYKITDH